MYFKNLTQIPKGLEPWLCEASGALVGFPLTYAHSYKARLSEETVEPSPNLSDFGTPVTNLMSRTRT